MNAPILTRNWRATITRQYNDHDQWAGERGLLWQEEKTDNIDASWNDVDGVVLVQVAQGVRKCIQSFLHHSFVSVQYRLQQGACCNNLSGTVALNAFSKTYHRFTTQSNASTIPHFPRYRRCVSLQFHRFYTINIQCDCDNGLQRQT